MIEMTLKIEEVAPGECKVDFTCPPCKATPKEIELAEVLRKALAAAMDKRPGALRYDGGRS